MTVAENQEAIDYLRHEVEGLKYKLDEAMEMAQSREEKVTTALQAAIADLASAGAEDAHSYNIGIYKLVVAVMMALQGNKLNTSARMRQELIDLFFDGDDPSIELFPWIKDMTRS